MPFTITYSIRLLVSSRPCSVDPIHNPLIPLFSFPYFVLSVGLRIRVFLMVDNNYTLSGCIFFLESLKFSELFLNIDSKYQRG